MQIDAEARSTTDCLACEADSRRCDGAPAIVSWSVSVTKSMPSRFAFWYASSGLVYDSGNSAFFRNQLPVSVEAF